MPLRIRDRLPGGLQPRRHVCEYRFRLRRHPRPPRWSTVRMMRPLVWTATLCIGSPTVSKQGIRVRGTCSAGHVTESNAAPKRATQTGECGHEGCEVTVRRTRIPTATPEATKPATKTEEPAGEESGLVRVREAKI